MKDKTFSKVDDLMESLFPKYSQFQREDTLDASFIEANSFVSKLTDEFKNRLANPRRGKTR